MTDRLMTVDEVADVLHVSRSTVYRIGDLLPRLKIEGAVRFRPADVEAYVRSLVYTETRPPDVRHRVLEIAQR